MHWLPPGMALLLAIATIAIGIRYTFSPVTATRSSGLPLPENGTNIAWWLRLKGVRDIAAGLAVLAKGSTKSAFGIHGLTAVVMVLAATSMMIGRT